MGIPVIGRYLLPKTVLPRRSGPRGSDAVGAVASRPCADGSSRHPRLIRSPATSTRSTTASTLLEPNYNVAPTHDVYAVLVDGGSAPARSAALGSGAVLGQGSLGGQPDDQRPGRDPGDEERLPPGLPQSAVASSRPTASTSGRSSPARSASSRCTSAGPTASRWPSPDCGRCGATPRHRASELHSCTIITGAANEKMAAVHDRMPIMLPPSAWETWLDPEVRRPRPARQVPGAGAARAHRAATGEHRGQQRPQHGTAAARSVRARPGPRARLAHLGLRTTEQHPPALAGTARQRGHRPLRALDRGRGPVRRARGHVAGPGPLAARLGRPGRVHAGLLADPPRPRSDHDRHHRHRTCSPNKAPSPSTRWPS